MTYLDLRKGLELPTFNPTQERLWKTHLTLGQEEDQGCGYDNHERVDMILTHSDHDDALWVYTSQYIEVGTTFMSFQTSKHLQLQRLWKVWDETPNGDMCDIYADRDADTTYREVMLRDYWSTISNAQVARNWCDDLHLDYLP